MTTIIKGDRAANHLLGVVAASLLQPAYLASFAASIHFLHNVRGRRVQPNKAILAISIFLCMGIITVRTGFFVGSRYNLTLAQHWILGVTFAYQAFIGRAHLPNGATNLYWSLPSIEIAQLYVYLVVVALMDSAIVRVLPSIFVRTLILQVYRMYIVWNRRWQVVVIPCIGIIVYTVFANVRSALVTNLRRLTSHAAGSAGRITHRPADDRHSERRRGAERE